MKWTLFILINSALFIALCVSNISTDVEPELIESTLQSLLEEALVHSHGNVKGVSMSIQSSDFKWSGAAGYDSNLKEDSLRTYQPFRIASVTKPFVAVAILRLHETEQLSIDDPISKYISEKHIDILKSHDYNPEKITIRHCLHHTSGLFNYARVDIPFADSIVTRPNKRWTRTQQLEGAMIWGDKVGEPGELYSYCDTGYILLGEIIESFFQGNLASGLRNLLKFDELGMNSTWLESLESHPAESLKPVHRYFNNTDVTQHDPSIDLYGGGGLMSTCQDLATFLQALFNHKVYDKESTLDLMLTKANYFESYDRTKDRRYEDYRMGLIEIDVFGETAYLHSGFWGTLFVHIPARNISYATNCTSRSSERMLKKAILLLNQLNDNS